MRSAVPFRSGNYYHPIVFVSAGLHWYLRKRNVSVTDGCCSSRQLLCEHLATLFSHEIATATTWRSNRCRDREHTQRLVRIVLSRHDTNALLCNRMMLKCRNSEAYIISWTFTVHCVPNETTPLLFLPYLCFLFTDFNSFYPRDALHSAVFAIVWCLCICIQSISLFATECRKERKEKRNTLQYQTSKT